jgi:hypothetical protein
MKEKEREKDSDDCFNKVQFLLGFSFFQKLVSLFSLALFLLLRGGGPEPGLSQCLDYAAQEYRVRVAV